MKFITMINIFRWVLLVTCGFSLAVTYADVSKDTELNFPLSSEWSEPVFKRYTSQSINKTNERRWRWQYTRENATLIVTRSECEKCKPVTQQTVDEYNSSEAQVLGSSSALLLGFKGAPAILRLSTNRKNVNFRVFQIYANGFYYKIQLGVNKSTTHEFSFQLENEFIEMINGFVP